MRVRHSKLLALIGAGILAVTTLVACGNGDATANTASSAEASTVAASSEVASTETTADLSGSISMVGSTSMEKLANALSEAFMEEYPDVTVTAEFVGSGAGIEAVTNGTADIGNSSRSLKDEEKAAGVAENIVAIDGIAVCVDPANEVADLTKEQLTNIYNGTVTNWKEVGGADEPIIVIGREAGSGTRGAFEELVDLKDACKYANELDSTGAVQFVCIFAGILQVNQLFKSTSGTGTCLTADHDDRLICAADFFPVGNCAIVDVRQLLFGQICYFVSRIYTYSNTVNCYYVLCNTCCLFLIL